MPTIIITKIKGVSIMNCPDETRLDSALSKWQKEHPGKYVSHRVGDDSERQTDRTFRDACKDTSGVLEVSMPIARDIHREDLRCVRKPLLAALDVEYMRADERGDALEKSRIAALKQALRDVTADPRIETAQTPEALKLVWPDVLA